MHIGLFGGSFDPPHICHLLFCAWVLEMEGLDRILWVPCAEHPFGKQGASYEHRLEMSRLAAGAFPSRVMVSDLESRLPRPSYTINTVETLLREMPGDRISVLIGSDLLDEIEQWERIDELRRKAGFVVVPRGGATRSGGDLSVAIPALSSTEIRDALREGRSVKGVVTPAVLSYIERNGLYRS